MAKMNDVKYGVPENFLSGLGQYSYEDMLMDAALGFAAADEDDILMGLSGLGQMTFGSQVHSASSLRRRPPPGRPNMRRMPPPGKPKSVMDAIIANAKELNAKKAIVAQTQKQAAAASPIVAIALAKKQRRTSMPGASETRGIIIAANTAAKKAVMAKKDEAAAKKLLSQSDKRGAAAKAVSALTKAREAAILANKAEKSRLTRALDILANTLNAQADYLEQLVKMESARSGQSPRTMALMATAQTLRQQVKRIKAQSGVVAAMPNVPANAPSQQRIADLANKFNIRTAKKAKFMLDKATIAVLGDLAEDPMAQVTDYEGALSYYGVDGLGKLMADMEFDNYSEAADGLAGLMGGIGYTDTTPILAQADDVVAAASTLATATYNDVVLPAAGLGGFGFSGPSWEEWCDKNVPSGATDSAKAYKGNVAQCRAQPNPIAKIQAPWTLPGIQARGGDVNWAKAITDIPKAVAKAAEDVKKAGAQVQQAVTGKKPAPPAAAKPPVAVPAPTPTVAEKAKEAAAEIAVTAKDIITAPAAGGVPGYVYIAAGVALVGGYWFFLRPKAAAAV